MTEEPGHMQSKPLMEECSEAAWEYYGNSYGLEDELEAGVRGAIEVLRRRGLLNLQGLEIIKREME